MTVSGLPERVRASAAALLADVSPDRREIFDVRLERWWADLHGGLSAVYSPGVVETLEIRLLHSAARAYAERPADLHRLDLARGLERDWFQSPRMLGYAAYADRLAADIPGVAGQIPYLRELGVTYLHLMPLLRSRGGNSDGGYAVSDYRSVRPDLGTMDDVRALATALRREGISLVLDLVLNHVAREHEWAVAARAGDERYRAYFHVHPDRTLPDQYERTLPEVFPDFAPGNFTWDEDLSAWVWTTFNDFQWDLNWANADVFAEFADIVLFLAGAGVEVVRLDAIAFLWKRMGTNCQNQPEVHAITQALRSLLRIACPATLLKAEAIVGPDDLAHYLGTRAASRQGQRPRLPQHADGAGVVDARLARRPAHDARPARDAARPEHHGVDHLPALPRRHRLGHRRCQRSRGGAVGVRAPGVPVGLLHR